MLSIRQEESNLLTKRDFTLLFLKVREYESELKRVFNDLKNPIEVDKATENKIRELIDFIADDDFLGKDRFNKLISHLKPLFKLPHFQNFPNSGKS